MTKNRPASHHDFFALSDPIIKKLNVGINDLRMILKQILIKFDKGLLDFNVPAFKLWDLFGFLLVGIFLVLNFFPQLRNYLLEFNVLFSDDTLADLLVCGWLYVLSALSATSCAFADSGRRYFLQFLQLDFQFIDLNLKLLTFNDFFLMQFEYGKVFFPLSFYWGSIMAKFLLRFFQLLFQLPYFIFIILLSSLVNSGNILTDFMVKV
jgi:hypothetical protein